MHFNNTLVGQRLPSTLRNTISMLNLASNLLRFHDKLSNDKHNPNKKYMFPNKTHFTLNSQGWIGVGCTADAVENLQMNFEKG